MDAVVLDLVNEAIPLSKRSVHLIGHDTLGTLLTWVLLQHGEGRFLRRLSFFVVSIALELNCSHQRSNIARIAVPCVRIDRSLLKHNHRRGEQNCLCIVESAHSCSRRAAHGVARSDDVVLVDIGHGKRVLVELLRLIHERAHRERAFFRAIKIPLRVTGSELVNRNHHETTTRKLHRPRLMVASIACIAVIHEDGRSWSGVGCILRAIHQPAEFGAIVSREFDAIDGDISHSGHDAPID